MSYRIEVAGSEVSPDTFTSLYVERACADLDVRLNGSLIFRSAEMDGPLFWSCLRPRLIDLPSALLNPGTNVVELRIHARALDSVASIRSVGGLSAVELGRRLALTDAHRTSLYLVPCAIDTINVLLVALALILLVVAWRYRHEAYFAYLGWLCLCWVALSLGTQAGASRPGLSSVNVALGVLSAVLVGLAFQFFLSYANVRSRVIEKLILLQCALVALALLVGADAHQFGIARVLDVLFTAELLYVMYIHFDITRKQEHGRVSASMTLVSVIAAGCLFLELLTQFGLVESLPLPPGQVVVPLLLLLVGARLFMGYTGALDIANAQRHRLASQLQIVTAEIETRAGHLAAEHAETFRDAERKRIASDLHDDLGAKLLTIVHTDDITRIPQLARDALDEMRLSLRGLAGKPIHLSDALADWRAEIKVRLEEAGISCRWDDSPDGESHLLPGRSVIQLTRILREAVSNVIKHSAARSCRVTCTIADQAFHVSVRDDGRGISTDLRRGQGMSSMKRRAKKLNGQCLVESAPGSGVVIRLTVPL